MIKRQELANPKSCLNKAADEEPVFVLRASDKLAPLMVALWAELALEHGCHPHKVEEARDLADQMRRWPNRKFPD